MLNLKQIVQHIPPVILTLILILITIALTFLSVRYYDFQNFRNDKEREIVSLREKYESKIDALNNRIDISLMANKHLRETIDEPIIYEAVPKGNIPEVKDE